MEQTKYYVAHQYYFMSLTLYTKLEKKSAADLLVLLNNFKLPAETNIWIPEFS